MYIPDKTSPLHGGTQQIVRCDNGYGASIVRHSFSYGSDEGLFELGVFYYPCANSDECALDYSTPITDDVIGSLTEAEIEEMLGRIESLPKKEEPASTAENERVKT